MADQGTLKEALARRGIKDAGAYLDVRGKTIEVAKSNNPDVHLRGSVHLMTGRKISRQEVDRRLEELKHA